MQGGQARPVTGSWTGGQEEVGGITCHTQMWVPPSPGWPGATGSVLSASWMPGVSRPAIPKLGVHPACWLTFLLPDGLVLSWPEQMPFLAPASSRLGVRL